MRILGHALLLLQVDSDGEDAPGGTGAGKAKAGEGELSDSDSESSAALQGGQPMHTAGTAGGEPQAQQRGQAANGNASDDDDEEEEEEGTAAGSCDPFAVRHCCSSMVLHAGDMAAASHADCIFSWPAAATQEDELQA